MSATFRQVQAHNNGDCWPDTCPCCEYEALQEEDATEPTYGMCTACGSVEVALIKVTGTRDLSSIGEHSAYPTGYGCEVCS